MNTDWVLNDNKKLLFLKNFIYFHWDCFTIVVLVSPIHQYESVIGIHMSPPSSSPLPPPIASHPSRLSQSTASSTSPLALCLAYDNVRISVLISQFIPEPSSSQGHSLLPWGTLSCPCCVVGQFSRFESLFLPCKQIPQYHFSRFHIYALTYLFFSF